MHIHIGQQRIFLKIFQEIEDGRVHIAEIEKYCWNEFRKINLKRNELQIDLLKVFDIRWHWPIRHICWRIWPNFHHWKITGDIPSWRNYFHSAKCDYPDWIMEEGLDNVGKLAVPNLGYTIPKLTARHKCQQIVPIFQWKLAGNFNFIVAFFLLKDENSHFHFMNWHIFCFANLLLIFRDHFFQLKMKVYYLPVPFFLPFSAFLQNFYFPLSASRFLSNY
jgi:hypothetical protein